MKIGIITDSTCDLTKELLEENNIEELPLYVTIGGKTYQDGVDITCKELYALVDKLGELPKSAGASITAFEEYFANYLEKYDQLVYCGIGSKLSGTYQSAIKAKESFPDDKIYIIDSANLSSGIGLLVLKACKFRDEGKTGKEIKEEVDKIVPNVRTQFAINTLKYMHMGGRCSGVSRLLSITLNIKPIIKVIDGGLKVGKKPIGYQRALKSMLEDINNDKDRLDTDYVMVTHAAGDSDAVYLKAELKKMLPNQRVCETFAGGVIATHCGPRTIGILYIVK